MAPHQIILNDEFRMSSIPITPPLSESLVPFTKGAREATSALMSHHRTSSEKIESRSDTRLGPPPLKIDDIGHNQSCVQLSRVQSRQESRVAKDTRRTKGGKHWQN